MKRQLPLLFLFVIVSIAARPCSAQTVLFDFESGAQGWNSFGPVTTDSGAWPFGSDGFGRFHTADFNLTGWGMVDVSTLTAPLLDLSGYSGIRVDARFHSVAGYPDYSGHRMLDIGLGFGPGAETEYYAPPVTLTDDFQTFDVPFDSMQLGPAADLSQAVIKLRFLNDDINSGVGQLDYDQIVGLPIPELDGDYNEDGRVDAADYVSWRKNDGTSEGYASWRNNFGAAAGAGASHWVARSGAAVPEPAGIVFLLVGSSLAVVQRLRRPASRL